jgi:YVTN family beta-propeller protein
MRLARAFLLVLTLLAAIPATAGAGTAYVLSIEGVARIDTATNQPAGPRIQADFIPFAMAITPDASRLYLANIFNDTLSALTTATGREEAPAMLTGENPIAIAVAPDGSHIYVANTNSDDVSVIDTATEEPALARIPVGALPEAIAVAPDGGRVYVLNRGIGMFPSSTVSVIDTSTNRVVGGAIPVGNESKGLTIAPDGSRLYVANLRNDTVSVIDTAANLVVATIPVGDEPIDVAITPDGREVYVPVPGDDAVAVIDTTTNTVMSVPDGQGIAVGGTPNLIAIAPGGRRAFVTNLADGTMSVIDTVSKRKAEGAPIPVGNPPSAIVVASNRGPVAGAIGLPAEVRAGTPFALDASTSTDPEGVVASYAWDFGDGQSQAIAAPVATHTYAAPGTYTVTLTVADEEGCSTSGSQVFTGRETLGCAGSPQASRTATITVLPALPKKGRGRDGDGRSGAGGPRVKLSCPKSARPRGCSFKLQAVARKPKRGKRPQFTSAVAKAKLKPGRSILVPLVAKAAFRARLETARTILVKLDAKVGKARKVGYRRLKLLR